MVKHVRVDGAYGNVHASMVIYVNHKNQKSHEYNCLSIYLYTHLVALTVFIAKVGGVD